MCVRQLPVCTTITRCAHIASPISSHVVDPQAWTQHLAQTFLERGGTVERLSVQALAQEGGGVVVGEGGRGRARRGRGQMPDMQVQLWSTTERRPALRGGTVPTGGGGASPRLRGRGTDRQIQQRGMAVQVGPTEVSPAGAWRACGFPQTWRALQAGT